MFCCLLYKVGPLVMCVLILVRPKDPKNGVLKINTPELFQVVGNDNKTTLILSFFK